MNRLIYLAAGGLLGTFGRYFLAGAVHRIAGGNFPVHTLIINLAGCFILGAFIGWDKEHMLSHEWKLFVAVGFCGAFTTFSTFMMETASLVEKGQILMGFVNVLASVTFGYILFFLGLWTVRIF